MSSAPLPMNRKERRAAKAGPPTLETTPLMVVFVKRREIKQPDGAVVAVSYFAPVTANGRPLLEDAGVDGPQPVIFESRPVVVKAPSAILTGPGLVRP